MPIGRTRGSSIGFTVNQENRFTKGRIDVKRTVSVSYTHLTLPTILLV